MADGIKCPPASHRYVPLGKIVYCKRCADVRPLLLDARDETQRVNNWTIPEVPSETIEDEPTQEEVEAHIARVRDYAGMTGANAIRDVDAALDKTLGHRTLFEGTFENEEMIEDAPLVYPDRPNANDDSLPRPGI